MGRVSGKVAIITGGARGLGEAYVRLLCAEGAKVLFTDILGSEGRALEKALGHNVQFMQHDVVNETEWKAVADAAEAKFGPVNVLINNAGVTGSAAIDEYALSEFRRVMDINVIGVFLGMKLVVPSMRRAGGGAIINVSSTSGLRGVSHTLAYTASKFAVRGMTKAAAVELAADGIRVNSLHPGPTRSPMIEGPDVPANIIQSVVEGIPVKRVGEPEELANMVLLLASDEVRFATGAEFVVDGGLTCR